MSSRRATHLDRCQVLRERVYGLRLGHVGRPDVEQVVVAPAGQMPAVCWPLEAAHLLRVSGQRGHVVVGHAHVVVVDVAAARPAENKTREQFVLNENISKLKMKIIAVNFQFKQREWRMLKTYRHAVTL